MKNLKDILYGVAITEVLGDTNLEVAGLAFDSRKVLNDFCYIAQKGTQVDGHDFIEGSAQSGAIAVVCEELPAQIEKGITYIKVKKSAEGGSDAHDTQFFLNIWVCNIGGGLLGYAYPPEAAPNWSSTIVPNDKGLWGVVISPEVFGFDNPFANGQP